MAGGRTGDVTTYMAPTAEAAYWHSYPGHTQVTQHQSWAAMACFITARCSASAVLAMALCPSVCLSVCPSVTSRSPTKTAKRRITQTTSHDSPGTLVFGRQRSPRNCTRITPAGAPNTGGVGQNRRLSTNSWLYLENGTR